MPRKYKSKYRNSQYSKASLADAVNAVRNGTNVSAAAKQYDIPRSTIRRNISIQCKTVGGQTVFSKKQETDLANRLIDLCKRGFPLSIDQFLESAYAYAAKLFRRGIIRKIPNSWTTAKKASRDWWDGFSKRHKNLSLRKPEGLSVQRAQAFNKDRVDSFFADLEGKINELDVANYPQLIFNVDETGLSTVPNHSSKVIAPRGSRNVQSIQVGERGTLTTIVPAVNAAGETLPPFVVVKGSANNVPLDIRDIYKEQGITVTATKSGYMDADTYLLFLQHFQKWRPKIPGKKCLLIMDGHGSHVSIEAIEYCIDNGIEPICLPPHTSHRLQPLDTHYNKVLKGLWYNAVGTFLKESEETTLNRLSFAKLFVKIFPDMITKRGLIVDSFAYCGLHPLNKQCVKDAEYSKTTAFTQCTPVSTSKSSTSTAPTSQQDMPAATESSSAKTSNAKPNLPTKTPDLAPTLVTTPIPVQISPSVRSSAFLKSPVKRANPAHERPHISCLTSPQYLTNKRQKLRVKLPFGGKKPTPAQPTTAASHDPPSKKKAPAKVNKDPQPSTGQNPAPKPPKPKKAEQNCFCFVCGEKFGDLPGQDWFQCTICGEWCCELCFGTDTCVDCE